jgi:hypothetical protein
MEEEPQCKQVVELEATERQTPVVVPAVVQEATV